MRIPISQLTLLSARVDRVQCIVRCLGAVERCYWSKDLAKAEKTLQEALQSEPKPNL